MKLSYIRRIQHVVTPIANGMLVVPSENHKWIKLVRIISGAGIKGYYKAKPGHTHTHTHKHTFHMCT